MNKYLLFFCLSILLPYTLLSQDLQKRQMEKLDRGIVGIRTSPDSVYISWRLLGTDPKGIGFNLYRGSQKLNKKPLTEATNYIDKIAVDEFYSVRAVIKKKEQKESNSCKVWAQNYIRIPLNRPPGPPPGSEMEARLSNPRQYSYSPGDASVADLDGDGQYEIILKWDPSNARDNAQDGFTGNVILDAYELDGTQLWRINLGKNIRAGAHYTQFLVYDFDGDGKAEMACKTADGTIDGTGKVVGDSTKDYVNDRGRILDGPEYLTIFNGKTGEALRQSTIFLVVEMSAPGAQTNAKETVPTGSSPVLHTSTEFIRALFFAEAIMAGLPLLRGYGGMGT
jgi:rhamnogalacturonan endolyase